MVVLLVDLVDGSPSPRRRLSLVFGDSFLLVLVWEEDDTLEGPVCRLGPPLNFFGCGAASKVSDDCWLDLSEDATGSDPEVLVTEVEIVCDLNFTVQRPVLLNLGASS